MWRKWREHYRVTPLVGLMKVVEDLFQVHFLYLGSCGLRVYPTDLQELPHQALQALHVPDHQLHRPAGRPTPDDKAVLSGKETSLDPTFRRAMELVVRDVERLESLVGELLEISRIDAEAARAQVEEMDLEEVLHHLHESHEWGDTVMLPPLSPHERKLRTDRAVLERIVVN